jgi:hypothetical protein
MLPKAIRVLAATTVEMVSNPELVSSAWAELRREGGGGRRTA